MRNIKIKYNSIDGWFIEKKFDGITKWGVHKDGIIFNKQIDALLAYLRDEIIWEE